MSRRWLVLALIFFGILISYVDRGNLSIAAVEIMRDFGFSAALMGTLLSCFFWTYGAFQVPAGLFVDRYGIRNVYALAFLIWSLASASIAWSAGFGSILGSRLVLGTAESVGPLASLAFIRRTFAPAEQGLPTSVYIAGQTLGPALGAWLGTILLNAFGWRPMFAVTGLCALIWLVPWLLFAPRDGAPAAAPPAAPHPAARVIASNAAFWALSLCAFLLSYFWYFVLTWVPSYLRMTHGFTSLEMGRIMALPLAAMAVTSLGGGFLADRAARRWGSAIRARLVFAASGLIGASSLLALGFAPDRSWVLPVLFAAMCSFGVANSSYWALAQAAAPAALIGRSIGYLNTIAQVAGAAAPQITGWLIGPSHRFGPALVIAGLCPAVACVALFATGPRRISALRDALH
jgi:MFS transporter, ACS family, D-galactonate transporter